MYVMRAATRLHHRLGYAWIGLFVVNGWAWATPGADVLVLKAGTIYVGDGSVLENGLILIEKGEITSVGVDVEVPAGAKVIDLPHASITPGLIDAMASVESYDLMNTRVPVRRYVDPPAAERQHFDTQRPDDETSHEPDAARALGEWLTGKGLHVHHSHDDFSIHQGLSPEGVYADMKTDYPHGYVSDDDYVSPTKAESACEVCGGFDPGALNADVAPGVRLSYSGAEQSSEVIPHTRVLDSINPYSPDFDRLLNGGVTTVFVSGDPGAVISSRGCVLRTGGPMSERVVQEAGAVKATMGTDPCRRGGWNRPPWGQVNFHVRRPTTRMGVAWVFRKAFHDAARAAQGLPLLGADVPPQESFDTLNQVLRGETGLRVQARMQNDILTALRVCEEFGLNFTLEEGTEAYKCLKELKTRNIPVVYGPIYMDAPGYRGWSGEARDARLHTFKALLDEGIETALTAQELRDEDGLARQVMYALRFGVDFNDALKAVTLTPAKLLGLADRIGTVAPGKRADLVAWDGPPFAATSRIALVLLGGTVEVDRR